MSATATVQIDRAEINRLNSQHSTGPRTEAGKQRSSQNALRHGLTAQSVVTPSEDPAAYQRHLRQFMDGYLPATPTETQLVQQLADTSWRINRIPLLEAALFAEVRSPESRTPSPEPPAPAFDQLRDIQLERLQHERRELKDAAAILELHKYEGIPWEPSDHGFVFSKDQVERCSQRMMRQNQSRHVAFACFDMPSRLIPAVNTVTGYPFPDFHSAEPR